MAALGFIAAWAFSRLGGRAWASLCSGFCCCRTWALGAWASVIAVLGLKSTVS